VLQHAWWWGPWPVGANGRFALDIAPDYTAGGREGFWAEARCATLLLRSAWSFEQRDTDMGVHVDMHCCLVRACCSFPDVSRVPAISLRW
jgi:hypothetical protein